MNEMDVHSDSTLKGQRFGRWTLTGNYKRDRHNRYVECLCDCGTKKYISHYNLKKGISTSCGCYRSEQIIKNTIHGESSTSTHKMSRLYRIWAEMKTRCYNPNDSRYARYGGRGIVVCNEWKNSYPMFKKWATTNGYTDDLSIDRINNDGPYSPENCRWADRLTQANNKCNSRFIEAFGRTLTLSQWAREYDIPVKRLHLRLKRGWDIEIALIEKPYKGRRDQK